MLLIIKFNFNEFLKEKKLVCFVRSFGHEITFEFYLSSVDGWSDSENYTILRRFVKDRCV